MIKVTTEGKYTQFTNEDSNYLKAVHLLLRNVDEGGAALFQDEDVMRVITLAFCNNAYDCLSPHVSTMWRGRGIALELSRIALLRLVDGDSASSLRLLEAAHWVSDTFAGIGTRAFINNGAVSTLS